MNPVFLAAVVEHSISLEDTVFEWANVKIPVLEQLLAKAIKLTVLHISSLDHLELEHVLIAVSVGVVAAMAVPKDDVEA